MKLEYRSGIGYDIHRLVEGRRLFLCGMEVPYEKGLLGHSDGDAALHALCDALLGACALGDIGEFFPDSEPAYKDASSSLLLEKVRLAVLRKGFSVVNVDIVIIAQEPALRAYKSGMREKIAAILGISLEAVGVKAKTAEGLGEIGRKEAVAAYAAATVRRRES